MSQDVFAAADTYRDHFGEAAPVFQYAGAEGFAELLLEAVARGRPLTVEEIDEWLGWDPLPPDAMY